MRLHPAEASDKGEIDGVTATHAVTAAEDGGEDWVTKLLRTVESQASSGKI